MIDSVDNFDMELLTSSLSLFSENMPYGIGGRDSTLLASMKKHGVNDIMTHDKAFKRIPWIHVIDPIPEDLE